MMKMRDDTHTMTDGAGPMSGRKAKRVRVGRWLLLLVVALLGVGVVLFSKSVPYDVGVSHEGVTTKEGQADLVALLKELDGVVIDYRKSPYVTSEDCTQFNIEYRGAWYVCTVSHPKTRREIVNDEPVFAEAEGRFLPRERDFTLYRRTGDFYTTLSSFNKDAKHEGVMRELSAKMHAKILSVAVVDECPLWMDIGEKLAMRGKAKGSVWLVEIARWWSRVQSWWRGWSGGGGGTGFPP